MARVRAAVDLEPLFARIVDLVQAHGALPADDLRAARRHVPALTPRLVERGLEVGANVLVPLETQIGDRVQQGFVRGPVGTSLSWVSARVRDEVSR